MPQQPSVLAIISQAAFAELERSHGSITPGKLVLLDRYLSRKPAFDVLEGGGTMFLVTVRPPDERLWLVAVLENPTPEPDKWIAAPNRVPVADITSLIPKLKFSTGKGLSAKKGALGMSLQTPRQMTADDVALLSEHTGMPAAPMPAAPAPNPHAAYYGLVSGKTKGKQPKAAGAVAPAPSGDAPVPVSTGPLTVASALASLPAWQALADADRRTVLDQIVAALGAGFAVGNLRTGAAALATVVHDPTRTVLLLVPGGYLTMGFGADDILSVLNLVAKSERDTLGEDFGRARPVRLVRVRPFLFAIERLGDDAPATKQPWPEALHAAGFRLPSEAEWEWVAREGGAVRYVSTRPPYHHFMKLHIGFEENGWGARQLLDDNERVADSRHESYEGAPDTSAAWGEDEAHSRFGHTSFQESAEVIALHAAHRGGGSARACRCAHDVPGTDYPPAVADELAFTMTETLAALLGAQKKLRDNALEALAELAATGVAAGEAEPLARAVLQALPALEKGDKARGLRLLADAALGARSRLTEAHLAGAEHPRRPEILAVLGAAKEALLDLLADKDTKVRVSAGCVAILLDGGAARLTKLLGGEKNASVQAAWILCLAHAGERAIPRAYLTAGKAQLAAAAALGVLVAEGRAAIADELNQGLVAALTAGDPGEELMPWFAGAPAKLVLGLVQNGSAGLREAAVDAVLERARRETTPNDEIMRGAALFFAYSPIWQYPDPADLSPAQRRFALALCDDPLAVSTREPPLSEFGIPNDVWSRRIWLGLEPPGVLDREIEAPGQRGRVVLWRWLMATNNEVYGPFLDGTVNIHHLQPLHEAWEVAIAPLTESWDPIFALEVSLEESRLKSLLQCGSSLVSRLPTGWALALAHDEARAREAVARARATQAALMRFPKHEVPERVLDIFIDALREGENLEPEFDRLVATNGKSADLNKRLAKLSAACRDRIVNQTLLIIEDSRLDRLSWSWVRDRLLALLSLPLAPVTVRRIVRLPGIMLASGHLWAMMEKLAPENPVLEDALARLGEWRTLADDAPKAKRQACFNAYPMD